MSTYGETKAREVDGRIAASPATQTALQNIAATDRYDGQIAVVAADQTAWQFVLASSASSSAGLVLVPTDNPPTGRWLRCGASVVSSMVAPPADITALKAIPAAQRSTGLLAVLQSDGSKWRFSAASTLTGDDMLVATPAAGTGRWLRADSSVDITAAVTFATADAAVLYTVPTGFQLWIVVPFWHATISWTGGTNSAIGLSSSGGAMTTKGDLLGGSGGDVAAGLLSTGAYAKGTVGTDMNRPGALLVGGDTIRFDRIVDVFTAGAGVAHVPVLVLLAPAS